MGTCRAVLEGRLESTVALGVTTLAVPTTLRQISAMLETQWSDKIAAVAGRLVNAVAFAQAGSERSKKAAAALTGVGMHRLVCTAWHITLGAQSLIPAIVLSRSEPSCLCKIRPKTTSGAGRFAWTSWH